MGKLSIAPREISHSLRSKFCVCGRLTPYTASSSAGKGVEVMVDPRLNLSPPFSLQIKEITC